MDTLTLQVSGMRCEGCERRISNAVRRVDGVREIHADHRTGGVRVTVDSSTARRAAVMDRLEVAGFPVSAVTEIGPESAEASW